MTTRHLEWEPCWNVRDLGGLPTADGGTTRWGALVRADCLGKLTADGRRALYDYGVRTVIDLRGSSLTVPVGAGEVPGLVEALGE